MKRWGGRTAQAWTAAVLARYGTTCALKLDGCLGTATTGDHKIPRSVRPDLELDVTNGQPACMPCNTTRGAAPLELLVVDAVDLFESAADAGKDSSPSPPRELGEKRSNEDEEHGS